MQSNCLDFGLRRRGLLKCFTRIALGFMTVSVVDIGRELSFSRIDDRYVLVDGWVLPSAHFKK
jgi:hypothetical protein